MMIRNYIKVSLRNIQKRKLYSLINTIGLSVGLAFCLLIFLYVRDENSFDQFHANKDRIYRIEVKSYDYWNEDSSQEQKFSLHPYNQLALGIALKDEAPAVEYVTRFGSGFSAAVQYKDKLYKEEVTYVDADFFRIFSFDLVAGSLNKVFENSNTLVLTQSMAKKYFNGQSPIGQTIDVDHGGIRQYTVAAVLQDPPSQSSIDFDFLLPYQNWGAYERQMARWGNFNTPTIVQLTENATVENLRENMNAIKSKYMAEVIERWRHEGNVPEGIDVLQHDFTRIDDWHLKKEVEWHKVSDPDYSMILSSIAFLILIIAGINYISLALTSSVSRSMEVGVRKVMGAVRGQLIFQFGFESVVLTLGALVFALVLAVLFLPYFNEFTAKQIVLSWDIIGMLMGVGFATAVIVGLLAGSYPSFVLSGFKPATVLKGRSNRRFNINFVKPLVVIQFALSGFLIISSWVMFSQMRFITTKDIGYDTDQVLIIPTQTGWDEEAEKVLHNFGNALSANPDVLAIAGTSISFNKGWSLSGYKINGINRSAYVYGVDHRYIDLLRIELLEGRNFDPSNPADSNAVIVNEALVRDMGWEDPLSEHLNYREDSTSMGAKVIGVVKDYHFRSLEVTIDPMFLTMDKDFAGNLSNVMVKIAPNDLTATLDMLGKTWRELYPDKPFEYSFLDKDVESQYESYARWMSIMSLSTAFAILVSCLGLFGLAGINAVNRTKEVGIRKVMGAELSNIFVLLNKQFVGLSVIAFALAIPFSWYVMNKWLSGFEYRIEMDWMMFAVSTAVGTAIALVTVSYHALKAATTNPAETLKYE